MFGTGQLGEQALPFKILRFIIIVVLAPELSAAVTRKLNRHQDRQQRYGDGRRDHDGLHLDAVRRDPTGIVDDLVGHAMTADRKANVKEFCFTLNRSPARFLLTRVTAAPRTRTAPTA